MSKIYVGNIVSGPDRGNFCVYLKRRNVWPNYIILARFRKRRKARALAKYLNNQKVR